jgi:hypothetical protein
MGRGKRKILLFTTLAMKNVTILLSDKSWENAAWYARTSGINLDAICGAILEDYFGSESLELTGLQHPHLITSALAEMEAAHLFV